MPARNLGSIGETQFTTAIGSRQNRMGDFGLIRMTSVIYKMRGYHAASGQFEVWQATNPAAGPPSGRTLQNIVIAAIITQKELG